MTTIKSKRGRPTRYTSELATEICDAIAANSKGVKKLCAENPHWPNKDTIFTWIKNNSEFSDQYARAKAQQIEALVDEIIDIADNSTQDEIINDQGVRVCNSEFIARSRLRIDTRKWLAAKLCPRLYGDKEELVNLKFPSDIKDANALLPMATEIFRALGNQEITPGQAKTLLGTLKDYANAIGIIDLNQKFIELRNEIEGEKN